MESTQMPVEAMVTSRFYYTVGQHHLLLESELKTEVLHAQAIYPLPFAPSWCAGLSTVRGEMIPIVDMHRIILGRPAPSQTALLMIKHPQFAPVILTCDGYPRHIKVTEAQLTPQTKENLPTWIAHTIQYQQDILLAANHSKLLTHIRRIAKKHTAQ